MPPIPRRISTDGIAYTHNHRYNLTVTTDTGFVVSQARMLSGLSRRQVALMADLAPSTVLRVERGELDPTITTFERVLAACGYRYGSSLTPLVDPDAMLAARRILEPDSGLPATEGSATYAERWERAGLLAVDGRPKDRAEIARRAGRLSRLSHRAGARRFGIVEWQKVARVLRDNGKEWAMTGGHAAARYTNVANPTWPVFYVDDIDRTASDAGLSPIETGAGITLIPIDDITATGVEVTEDGAHWANPWQVVIDCYGGNGRMPDQAESMAAVLDSSSVR